MLRIPEKITSTERKSEVILTNGAKERAMNNKIIKDKAVKAYNTLISAFSEENLGSELFNKEFTIKLLTDKGAGIGNIQYFTKRFQSFGLSGYKITFTPNNPKSLKNAIASMITYLYSFPDTFAVIKQGYKNFLFADIYNIHSLEYVRESDYSLTVGGDFMWSGDGSTNGLTEENYDILAAEYSADDRFTDRDIRYLLGFDNDNIVSLILGKFETMFIEQVDGNIDIIDLRGRTSGFGDFPFRLTNYYDSDLIQELIDQGIDVDRSEVVADVRNRGIPPDNIHKLQPEASRIIWMVKERFSHILLPHRKLEFKNDFEIWDDATTIGNFVFNAIESFPIVNVYPGEGDNLSFMFTRFSKREIF